MNRSRKILAGGLLIFLSLYMLAEAFYGFDGPSVFRLGLSVFLGLYAVTKIFDVNLIEAFMAIGFIGVLNFKYLGFESGNRWILFIAAILMGTGLQMIFKKKRKYYNVNFSNGDFSKSSFEEGVIDADVEVEDHHDESQKYDSKAHQQEDFVNAETNFSDQKRYIRSSNFTKGRFENNFGNLELHFQGATFNPKGSEIYIDCNFGNARLYFPRTVNVENRLVAAMGSISGDSLFVSSESPTVILMGSANFGKISVRYL